MLYAQSLNFGISIMATGLSSIGQYAGMQRGAVLSAYCLNLNPFLEM